MKDMSNIKLEEEASAFDERIGEREQAGFIPDLRNAVKCEYFYKSFWREQHYIRLYLGEIVQTAQGLLEKYAGKNLNILDVGCGHGLMSLELARYGHNVTGIDISGKSIALAKKTADDFFDHEATGSLKYEVSSFEDFQAEGKYDVIFFCGSLHHMLDLELALSKAYSMVADNGFLYFHEPIHSAFSNKDAAQVALIRGLLSASGVWYDESETQGIESSESSFEKYTCEIHDEYVDERDRNEPAGQSPNDLEADGEEILNMAKRYFSVLETKPSFSFVYRVLGGIRGSDEQKYKIADLLSTYDKYMTKNGYLAPNYFHFIGSKVE